MIDQNVNKFEQNWEQNAAKFGRTTWEQEADFCYYIQSPVPQKAAQKLHQAGQVFKENRNLKGGQWLASETLHLTLTLPGRLGTHFQKNDLAFMKKTLAAITAQTPSFELTVERLNVFPHTLWAEIGDPSGRLQQLHETLCNEIPFSQHPEFRYQNYLPHVSLCYGAQTVTPLGLDVDRDFEPLVFTLDTLQLGRAQWQGHDLHKELSAEYHLKSS